MRAICPICTNVIRLRRDRTFYKHATTPNTGMHLVTITETNQCSGTHRTIDQAQMIREDREQRKDLWSDGF